LTDESGNDYLVPTLTLKGGAALAGESNYDAKTLDG
jgi:hypothetical protein